MISINPKDAVIRKQVQSVQFGFYNDDDVRKRSILEITSSQAFDPMGHALPGGLYDPRLGSVDRAVPCVTCAMPMSECPGHYAHIELAVPTYHTLLFMDIVMLMRLKCLNCHKLQAAARQLAIYRAKFQLLYQHNVARLLELDDELARAASSASMSMLEASDGPPTSRSSGGATSNRAAAGRAMDFVLRELQPSHDDDTMTTSTSPLNRKLNSYELRLRKELIHACISDCKRAKKCEHCGCFNPKIRQDSANKIFQVALSNQSKKRNAQENIRLVSALKQVSSDASAAVDSDDSAHERGARYLDDDNDMDVDNDDDDEEDSDAESDSDAKKKAPSSKQDKFMHPAEVEAQLARTWKVDTFLCNCLFGNGPSMNTEAYKIYFVRAVPVPPSRFRPSMHLNGMSVEHSQSQYLSKIISLNELLRTQFASGDEDRAYTTWIELQTNVNCFMDSSKYPGATPANQVAPGIRQILERKEGLFRKNMMGKRVDYACRSVISPDPYVGTNEIGLPRYFATVLTYPTPVTDLNIKEMRELVERGIEYPGARWVEISGKRVDLSKMKKHKREAIAAQLLTHVKKKGGMPALVGRQLRDGDYVLMNRQPTLHKPGIMAHRVRLLHNPTQKTIRMHYANCNTYNADYDGDEMNCHFPQSDLARAEAQYIAKTDLQYIVPTDGSPLRGLIQDHVVGGVMITKKDTFFEKWMYQQLVFAALASLPGLEVIRADMAIELLPPAIIRPRELWTGKQVMSTLLLHLKKGTGKGDVESPGLSMERKAKTPESATGHEENLVLIRDGEMLRGVLDKNAFGATEFSLVHAVYEAYGPEKAGLLLNALGRLFTAYIQNYAGHSCRVEDLMLTKEADDERATLVQQAYNLGSRAAKAWADSEGGKVPIRPVSESDSAPLKPVEAAAASAKIGQLLSGNEGKENFAALDSYMQGQLNPMASQIVKRCLPRGLVVPFPHNTFGVMTMTGAKGSIVNQSQVTCALGQQALEGRRVPRLSSGRTLPSFAPYDPNPRADGFVMDRFLTGVRPQEYYHHCMAGREGLVDTAVKTSRSGYLQRCLVKHLEELKICYDYTVRNAEGGVIQFNYGEDGLDPTQAPYLDCSTSSFEYMARNFDSLKLRNSGLPDSTLSIAAEDATLNDQINRGADRHIQMGDVVQARRLKHGKEWKLGSLSIGWHRAKIIKEHKRNSFDIQYESDGFILKRVPVEADLGDCGTRKTPAQTNVATILRLVAADPILLSTRGHRVGISGACVSEKVALAAYNAMASRQVTSALDQGKMTRDDLSSLIAAKYASSLCAPGEAVGSIAAQSVGEPSTQMTLNTFHLAGAGANVTLGIPRLREIIMTASREPKTPTMSVPLLKSVTDRQALRLARDFSKLTLMELIAGKRGVTVRESLEQGDAGEWMRNYFVTLRFYPTERIREAFGLSLNDIAMVVTRRFIPALSRNTKLELKRSGEDFDILGGEVSDIKGGGGDGGDEEDNEAEGAAPKRAAAANAEMLNDDDADEELDDDDDVDAEEDGADGEKCKRRATNATYDYDKDKDGDDAAADENGSGGKRPTAGDDDSDAASATAMDDDADSVTIDKTSIALQALQVEPEAPPLLMVGIVEHTAAKTLVRFKKHIDEAFVNDEEGDRGKCLQTAGVNFEEIWKLECVDHNRLVSNHVWAMRCAYGVEAARMSIVGQIKSVFGAYGIEVDPRHLSLIADYMTFDGGYKAMNRIGMEQSSSPFLRMSYETTCHFLKNAAMANESDDLTSPSGSIVLGRPVSHGTGSFSLLTKS